MAKAVKKAKSRNFEKEYNKVTKDFSTFSYQNNQQEWSTPGDFFVKFSIYKEIPSGTTTSNTTFISQ